MGTTYKGRDAKLVVIAARFTDDEAAELDKAVAKVSKAARQRGGTNYAKADIVRAGVLDLARWINTKGDKHMDEVLAVVEEAMT